MSHSWGGGALFFEIFDRVKFSYLSDLNLDLVIAYNVIKKEPQKVINLLRKYKNNHSIDYYYKLRRKQEIGCPIANTARLIYLLKTCYNGLYRTNSSGEFNTPAGSYDNPNIVDKSNLLLVKGALQNAEIKYQDFSKIEPQKGDLVYFDPPYHPINGGSFTQYISNGFSEKDQKRLRNFALELTKKKVNIMLSNSDTAFINEIYRKDFIISKIQAPRTVNCKATKRKPVFELLITNYEYA